MYSQAPEAGLASLLASRGRGGDTTLVHMGPEEVAGLRRLAMAHGGDLEVNPDTGLYQANILKKILPMVIGAVLPGVPVLGQLAGSIGTAVGSQALGSALLVGGATALIEGDLKKGLQAGLGAYSGATLREAFQASSVPAPQKVSAEEVAKTNQAIKTAQDTVGASAESVRAAMPDVAGPPDVASGMGGSFTQPSPDGLEYFKSANVFKGTPTAADLSAGRAAIAADTGIKGILQGAKNIFTSPQSREAFGNALGGGFESGLGQNLSRYATIAGVTDAFTPEYEMPSGSAEDDTMYIPGGFNPMYGMGAQYGRFLPGQYYKKTKKGYVPYNPYAKAPGYATGGPVQPADQDMNQQRGIPHQNPTFPYPNQSYPLSTVVKTNYSSSSPQPREIVSGYEAKIDPFTGEEKFARGGSVDDADMFMQEEQAGFDDSFAPRYVYQEPAYNPFAYQEPVYQQPEPVYQPSTPTPPSSPTVPPFVGIPVMPTLPPELYNSSRPTYREPEPIYEPPPPAYEPPVYKPPVYPEPEPIYEPPPPAYEPPVYKPPVYPEPEPIYEPPPPAYEPPVYKPPVYPEPEPIYEPPPPAYEPPVYKPPVYPEPEPIYEPPPPAYEPPVYKPPVYPEPEPVYRPSDDDRVTKPVEPVNVPVTPYSAPSLTARQSFKQMLYGPSPALTNTKPVMDYVAELNRRAISPAFYRYPNPFASYGGGGTGPGTGPGTDPGTDPGRGRDPTAGPVSGGRVGGVGGGPAGGGPGSGRTGVGAGGSNYYKDFKPNIQDKFPVNIDPTKAVDKALGNTAKDKFLDWAKYRFTDPTGMVGTAIGLTGAGMLGTYIWDRLSPKVKEYFTGVDKVLTPEEAAEADAEAAAITQTMPSQGGGGGADRGTGGGAGNYGGGVGGGSGFAGGNTASRIPKYGVKVLPVKKGGRIRAMQMGGAIGEDYNFGFAAGGLGSLPEYKAGGKLLDGPGDGMSDSIPAVIRGKGVQRAALADGEFVVPADVVSHLGNGSTKAGAKKLYAMMNRIRQARTGKTRQAPEVKADKYLPA